MNGNWTACSPKNGYDKRGYDNYPKHDFYPKHDDCRKDDCYEKCDDHRKDDCHPKCDDHSECPLSDILKKFKGMEVVLVFEDLEDNGEANGRNLEGRILSVCDDVLELCQDDTGRTIWVNICCICYFFCD